MDIISNILLNNSHYFKLESCYTQHVDDVDSYQYNVLLAYHGILSIITVQ